MEDFFPAMIVMIGIVASIISSGKKEQAKRAAESNRAAAAKAGIEAARQKMQAARQESRRAEPIQPSITPTVHAHVQPDCETHDAPTVGSLGFTSTEGKDPCHEPMLSHARTPEPAEQQSALTFDWTGENMVKAFVMQEVLTRPAQRRRA